MSLLPIKTAYADLTGSSISIYKGSCWRVDISVYEKEGCQRTEEDYDLEGYTGRMQIRATTDSPVIAEPTVTVEGNVISLTLSDEETAAIELPGVTPVDTTLAWYDLFLDNEEDGCSYKILQGQIQLVPSITTEEEEE